MTDWIRKGFYEKLGYELYKTLPNYRTKWFDGSTATPSQLSFLMGLIKEYRFADDGRINTVVEVGTCHGISALYMLKAGTMYNKKYHQYDIEVRNSEFYGEAVRKEASPEELEHWTFLNGKTTFDIENVLSKVEPIDMIFIDGAHAHPYPLFDLIMLLPFMRKDALICLHDVEFYDCPGELGGAYIYTGWREKKYLNQCVENNSLESLGVLKIHEKKHELYDNLIELARQEIVEPFFNYTLTSQMPFRGGRLGLSSDGVAIKLIPFMRKYYPSDFVNQFWDVLNEELHAYQKHWVSLRHMNRLMYSYLEGIEALQKRVTDLELRIFRQYVEAHVPKGSKLSIFGAGFVGRQVYAALANKKDYEIILWVDNGHRYLGFEVMAPEKLKNKDFDYVLVAVDKEKMRDEIIMQLQEMGIDNTLIVWVPNLNN